MSLKLIFVFILIFWFTECEDWCSLINHPNGSFRGLGIYQYFTDQTENIRVMHNRDGMQWNFTIINPGVEGQMRIEMIENSSKALSSDNSSKVVHRFGVYELLDFRTEVRNCEVLSNVRTYYQLS